MRIKLRLCALSLLAVLATYAENVSAQQTTDPCAQIKYSEPAARAFHFRLNRIEGQAVYGDVAEKGEFQMVPGICVALFDTREKRLAAHVTTDERGEFQFADVAPGEYVLVVSIPPLHEIVVPVNVAVKAKGVKSWRLLLHLRSKEDRRRSFVTPVTEPALRQELLKRVAEDQAIRDELIQKGAEHPDKNVLADLALIDADNTARLKEIVKRYGWPGPELVGIDGADAAFLILQHSPEIGFQKAMLPRVLKAYRAGEIKAWDYALLLDRVLTRLGKPQVYGMAVERWNGHEPVLFPIEDEANVDKRRAEIGLPPLSEYLEFMKRMYFPQTN